MTGDKNSEATDVSAGNGHNTEASSNPSIANIPPQMTYRHECTMIYADDWTTAHTRRRTPTKLPRPTRAATKRWAATNATPISGASPTITEALSEPPPPRGGNIPNIRHRRGGPRASHIKRIGGARRPSINSTNKHYTTHTHHDM